MRFLVAAVLSIPAFSAGYVSAGYVSAGYVSADPTPSPPSNFVASIVGDDPALAIGGSDASPTNDRSPRLEWSASSMAQSPITPPGRWATPAARTNRLVLVGDSLAHEVTPILQYVVSGKRFVPRYWGGTAPCDWTDVNLDANRMSVVVISFTGNSLTECMRGADGRFLADEALVDQYRYDVGTLIDRARRSGARVVLVGQPRHAPIVGADVVVAGINEVYRDFAQQYRFVSFVDAGASVENPDGTYADRLPCSPLDQWCDPDGTVVVRGDGVHFCPIGGESPCSVWSGGALRFALEIAVAVNNPRRFD